MKEKKKEKKDQALHVMPMGYTFSVRPVKGGAGTIYVWELKRYGKKVAEGNARSESFAAQDAGAELAKLASASAQTNASKNLLRTKLRALLDRRPYLVAGACELILQAGAGKGRLVEEAEQFELAWYNREPKQFRIPIPSGGRSLSPGQAAEQFFNVVEGLGWIKVEEGEVISTQGLRGWVDKTFGKEKFQ